MSVTQFCVRRTTQGVANGAIAGDLAFTFIGTAAFSNVAGQLRYQQFATCAVVSGDTNGDGSADFAIQLNGTHTLLATDFLL